MSLRRSSRVAAPAKAVASTIANVANAVLPSKKRARSTTKNTKIDSPSATNGVHNDGDAGPNTFSQTEDGFKVPATPSPNKKRRRADPRTPVAPPLTPTPSIVGRVAFSGAQGEPKAAKSLERPAEPHRTNAALQTPNGTQVLPSATVSSAITSSPSKLPGIRPTPTSTTATLLEDGKAHLLKVDPTLAALVGAHHCRIFAPEGLAEEIEPFASLSSEIMGQQISGAAAASIKQRFLELFPPSDAHPGPPAFPHPAIVAATKIEVLRSAGLSQRKAEYIQGLAERFRDGVLSARLLADASDDEVMEHLVAVRGLGVWSVQMFMCFGLKRMDVFSTGDLGVQRGMAVYKGRDVNKLRNKGGKWKYMSEQEMIDVAESFRPYRSLFMWYMWRIETAPGQGGTNVDAMQITGTS